MDLFVDIQKTLPGFSLKVKFEAGSEPLGLLGASGSGKSMTLRCIAGLDTPDRGRIVLNGRELFNSEKGINLPSRKRKIGFLFQNYALFPHLNVEQNIGLALDFMTPANRVKKIKQMITLVQLNGLEKRYPSQLSGGQQQRVALARALAVEPEAMLLDEPFSALDEYLRYQMVLQLMDTLSSFQGVALFVTHNIEEAYQLCNNILILANGRKEAYGNKDSIFTHPPSLAAARLTGCKNISKAKWISPGLIEALDWGCRLKINREFGAHKHLAVRAHHLHLASSYPNEDENIFLCWPSSRSETPFKTTIFLSVGAPPAGPWDYQLEGEISKEKWDELSTQPLPWSIQIKPEDLILI